MRITRYEVQLADVTREILAELAPAFARKQLQVQAELPDELPVAHVDLERMKVLLRNVFALSLKQSPPGSTVEVRLGPDENPQKLRFTIGYVARITPDKLDKIFDRLYQAENYISIMGEDEVGLGLAFAKHILEAHGGDIRAELAEGNRLVFTATVMK